MTLSRIQRDQLQVGMYIHAFDGSWFDHPFWSRNFLLRRESDLETVLRSDIATLLIDTSKGRDLPLPAQAWTQVPAEDTRTPDEKTAAATQVVNRARDVVRGVFDAARLGKAIESCAVSAVVEEVVTSIESNRHALLKVLRLKKKDEYTYLHSVAVCALMVNLARQLGIDEQAAAELEHGVALEALREKHITTALHVEEERLRDEAYAALEPELLARVRCKEDARWAENGRTLMSRADVIDDDEFDDDEDEDDDSDCHSHENDHGSTKATSVCSSKSTSARPVDGHPSEAPAEVPALYVAGSTPWLGAPSGFYYGTWGLPDLL